MNCIFERFLMNFCKLNCRDEYPEVHREYIDFQLSPFGMMFKEAADDGNRRDAFQSEYAGEAYS